MSANRPREDRPRWGRRALALALAGGLVGWPLAIAALVVALSKAFSVWGPDRPGQFADWAFNDPEMSGALALGGLVYGAPCGAALGLVAWLAWFLASRRRRRHPHVK